MVLREYLATKTKKEQLMKKHETVRKMTSGQLKDLSTTITGAIPSDLTFEEATKLTGAKGPLVSDIRHVIERHAGRTDNDKPATNRQPSGILHRLNDEPIIIPACDGKRTLAQATDVFRGWLDPDFKNWRTDKPGKATPETPTDVYELRRNATFEQMFGSLTDEPRKLVFEQDQIIEFVLTHPNWLHPQGWVTFFLFEVDGNLLVARAYRYSDAGLKARVRHFEDDDVCDAGDRDRLIAPQLQR
jgi:hypothetical protein